MKIKLVLITFVSSFILDDSALGQGALTPPGAPAPLFKTLDQIEPRTAITNRTSLMTITQPGSYYLTGGLTVSNGNGINIQTTNVTLDLNGFAIVSTAAVATGTGIQIANALKNIVIQNGSIAGSVTNNAGVFGGSGFLHGINFVSGQPFNVHVSGVSVSGISGAGINLSVGEPTVVECCTLRTIGGTGITASTIRHCSVTDCGGSVAINGDQVSDCRGESAAINGGGISAGTAMNCIGVGTGSGHGLTAEVAINCSGFSSGTGDGLVAIASAQNCSGTSSGSGDGLTAFSAQNCSGTSTGSGYGLNAGRIATGCNGAGTTNSPAGLFAPIASFCTGSRQNGTAVKATIGNSCLATSGTNSINNKYNMP